MNEKQTLLHRIVEVVVDCCATQLPNGQRTVTVEGVLSTERRGENYTMTRCILARQLRVMGFTTETIAMLLQRKESTIRDMYSRGDDYDRISWAYHVAYGQATIRCKQFMAE